MYLPLTRLFSLTRGWGGGWGRESPVFFLVPFFTCLFTHETGTSRREEIRAAVVLCRNPAWLGGLWGFRNHRRVLQLHNSFDEMVRVGRTCRVRRPPIVSWIYGSVDQERRPRTTQALLYGLEISVYSTYVWYVGTRSSKRGLQMFGSELARSHSFCPGAPCFICPSTKKPSRG